MSRCIGLSEPACVRARQEAAPENVRVGGIAGRKRIRIGLVQHLLPYFCEVVLVDHAALGITPRFCIAGFWISMDNLRSSDFRIRKQIPLLTIDFGTQQPYHH
jgi:hypothetical protein